VEFETVYRELTYSTEMIRALLAGLSAEEGREKPDAESWSALEVLCHVCDLDREDFSEHIDLILNRPNDDIRPIDPQGWILGRNYNQQDFESMQKKFFDQRRGLLEWLKSLAGANWDTQFTSKYGTTSAGEMLSSWAAHDNLHIRQLVELRRHRIEKITAPFEIAYAGDW